MFYSTKWEKNNQKFKVKTKMLTIQKLIKLPLFEQLYILTKRNMAYT